MQTTPRLRIAAGAGLLISVALAVFYLADFGGGGMAWRFYIDAAVYRAGGQFVLDGAELYHEQLFVGGEETGFPETSLPFTYPPFASLLFVPLALVSQTTAGVLFAVANLVLAWVATALLIDAVASARWRGRGAVAVTTAVLPLVLLAEPVRETIFFGQINLVLMVLVVLGTVARTPWARTWVGGVFVGLAAAIKLTPAVFGLYFLVHRRWAAAAATVASFLAFTGVAALILPRDSVDYWASTLADTDRIGGTAYAANQSIKGVLARTLGPEHPAESWLWLLLVGALIVLITVAMLRIHRTDGGVSRSGLVASLMVASMIAGLCSPVSWSHHWVWLVAAAIVFVAAALRTTGPARLTAGALGALTGLVGLVGPHWLLPHRDGVELLWPWWAQLTGSSYVLLGVLTVLTAVVLPRALTGAAGVDGALARVWSGVVLVAAALLSLGVLAAAVTGG